MIDHKDIVVEKVNSGEYFTEALSWYNSRFVRPKTEVVHSSILAFFTLVFLAISVITFMSVFPISTSEPFVVSRDLKLNETVTISQINLSDKNPTVGVIDFLVKEYVKSREEYLEDRINRNFRFVTGLSDEIVFDQYMNENDISNPNNPILLYGKQAKIEVEVKKVSLPKLPPLGSQLDFEKEYKAKVNYISNLIFLDNDGESRKMQATISFKYKEIIVDQESHDIKQLPELIVTGYKTRQL